MSTSVAGAAASALAGSAVPRLEMMPPIPPAQPSLPAKVRKNKNCGCRFGPGTRGVTANFVVRQMGAEQVCGGWSSECRESRDVDMAAEPVLWQCLANCTPPSGPVQRAGYSALGFCKGSGARGAALDGTLCRTRRIRGRAAKRVP